ncbi:hypothetical protein FTO70_14490 [Methanosarcina sp. KYL-1]|uniref:hypothetical protein n=1 Tax=Methanosarcina sp. KYL-1 TaxID=2602068 RepID=UPI00210096C2|nr:hypothetical protein [Methanosarcina sp. KYL-1]MCQ1536856.1 hypothetical protein [Methanosarcina sp. KYL-1]
MEDVIKQLGSQAALAKNMSLSLKKIGKPEENPSRRLSILKDEVKKMDRYMENCLFDPSFKARINAELAAFKKEISDLETRVKADFGRKLAENLGEHGFSLEGHYPRLRTSLYTFVVKLDANKVDIYYGPEFEKMETVKASPEVVAAKLLDLDRAVTGRAFDDEEFLGKLLEAYRICLLRSNRSNDSEIPVSELISAYSFVTQDQKFLQNPLKKYYGEYSRIMFSYDLFRLKKRKTEGFELRLITATRAETQKKSAFLWIPPRSGKGLGESVSRIKFRETE